MRFAMGATGGPPRFARYAQRVTPLSRLVALLATTGLLGVTSSSAAAQHAVRAVTSPRDAMRAAVTPAQQRPRREAFPHDKHAKLFPTCVGCHADIAAGTSTKTFPPEASCATCHNGTDTKRVEWRPPARPAPQGLVQFNHRSHFAKTDSAGRACVACHVAERLPTGTARYMDVAYARQVTCVGCHDHKASSHYAVDNKCSTCHVKLTDAVALGMAQVADLPQPESHAVRGFASNHTPGGDLALATCATCHSRESCARCHVNAASLRDVTTLGTDARVAALMRNKAAEYPVPASHEPETFKEAHGKDAMAPGATCANCHARSSCTACHTGAGGAPAIRRLAEPTTGARGVRLVNPMRRGVSALPIAGKPHAASDTGVRRVRAHEPGYLEDHAATAPAGGMTCEGCHTRRFCADCHAGETRRAFHPANYYVAHASDVYSADRECASCHNTEVFCRECHRASGIGSRQGRSGTYHTAQTLWLLQHGRAARQELTACTTCHTQATCIKCHGTTGWSVNPHGADFNADRLGKKAMAMCARCHITDPRRR